MDDLTEKLRYAAEHREAFLDMGREGRQLFLERFTTGKMVDQIMAVYEEFQ